MLAILLPTNPRVRVRVTPKKAPLGIAFASGRVGKKSFRFRLLSVRDYVYVLVCIVLITTMLTSKAVLALLARGGGEKDGGYASGLTFNLSVSLSFFVATFNLQLTPNRKFILCRLRCPLSSVQSRICETCCRTTPAVICTLSSI